MLHGKSKDEKRKILSQTLQNKKGLVLVSNFKEAVHLFSCSSTANAFGCFSKGFYLSLFSGCLALSFL
jgi:hypothetical protein